MRNFKLNAFALTALLFTACGPKSATQDSRSTAPVNETEFVGSAKDELTQLQASPYQSQCDLANNALKTKIVQFISNKPKKMTNAAGPKGTENLPKAQLVVFANSKLAEIPRASPSPNPWEPTKLSWVQLNQYLQDNQNNNTDPFKLWFYLNAQARSLLFDDNKRIVNGVNFSINHNNVSAIGPIKFAVDACVANSTCVAPEFSDELKSVIKTIPFYQAFVDELSKQADSTKKREIIQRFSGRMLQDGNAHVPVFNTGMSVTHDNTGTHIQVPLDATHFTSDEQNLIKTTIESTWKTSDTDVNVLIEDKNKEKTLSIYEVFFHADEPNQRPYVNPKDKTLNLFPFSSIRSIAHEFGHVIGLTDHYYTTFDEQKCEYSTEVNDYDLMSNSETGDVLADDWKAILESFGVASANPSATPVDPDTASKVKSADGAALTDSSSANKLDATNDSDSASKSNSPESAE